MGATVQAHCIVSRARLCISGYDGGGEEDRCIVVQRHCFSETELRSIEELGIL